MRKTREERFWDKVDRKGDDDCWMWTAASRGTSSNGAYGAAWDGRKITSAHRVSYMINVGEVPEGSIVCHRCDNPLCVNPKHLFIGSQRDNMQDTIKKGRAYRTSHKIDEDQALEILRLSYEERVPITTLGETYGVTASAISHLRTGRTHFATYQAYMAERRKQAA
jgi:hypothetical protein